MSPILVINWQDECSENATKDLIYPKTWAQKQESFDSPWVVYKNFLDSPDPVSNVTVHWSSSSWLQPDPAPEYTKSSITPDAGV